jgi:cephalosporin hydroxylase
MTLNALFDKYGTDKGASLHDLGDIYEPYFQSIKGRGVIEIGVLEGASLNALSEFFGQRSKIVGIDCNDKSQLQLRNNITIEKGAQADELFLESCVARHFNGNLDLVLDDASHLIDDQMASISVLHHYLSEGGLYIIEDVHVNNIGTALHNRPQKLSIETVYRYKSMKDWFTCIFRKQA